MKCSVCAQDIPEGRYSEHLESEHGVTDDPTAVLIQHLTGLRSTAGEGDGDEELPDEEPSDADAFDQFLAADRPAPEASDDEDEEPEAHEEPEEEDEVPAEPQEEDEVPAETEEADEVPAEPAAEDDDDAGDELTDEDEAEFERMLAVYPEVDLRKGAPPPPAETTEPTAAAEHPADGDEKTFAVWDEARGAAPAGKDEDVFVVAPSPAQEQARRRRLAALVGLGAVIILIAIAVVYLLTRDTGSNKTTATAPVTSPPATPAPTFLPGPQGGAPTTVVAPATTVPAATTAAPATPATTAAPPTTAAPTGNPAAQISFPQMQGSCNNGQLTVAGRATNNNAQTYTFSFHITFANSAGAVLGTADGSVAHAPPHTTGPFSASGSCTDVTNAASRNVQVTSITPG